MSDARCGRMVTLSDGRWQVCGRKIVRNGMCGIHARAVERREQKRRDWEDAYVKTRTARAQGAELVDVLSKLEVATDYDDRGNVILAFAEAEKLIARLTEKQQ